MVIRLQQQIVLLEEKIQILDRERASVCHEIAQLKSQLHQQNQIKPPVASSLTHQSSIQEKVALFRRLFKGREDIYPRRFVNSKTGKSGYSPVCEHEWKPRVCEKPKIKCGDCLHRAFIPITDQVITNHLAGYDNARGVSNDFVMGIYPLMKDEHCWFLAIDFDKASWQKDVHAFISACRENAIPYSTEISRSGKGAHVWIFFSEPVLAIEARKLGSYLLTQAMDAHPELGFESYDRLFPNQDTLPKGGFGNLIALPLQKKPRNEGHSVFVNDDFMVYADQWSYLSSVQRLSPRKLHNLIERAEQQNTILGVKLPLSEGDVEPWEISPSRKIKETVIADPLPKSVTIVVSNQMFIDTNNLPTVLQSKIIRLAAFQNPQFYKHQAMRLSTFNTPRIISCAQYYPNHIALPRGCQDDLLNLLDDLKMEPIIEDKRFEGNKIEDVQFQGKLTIEQEQVVGKLLKHDIGTLSATTAFGKTVIALNILAHRKVNTLIVVHRRQLLDQWLERIQMFLNLPTQVIGKIIGGKNKATGIIDVALIQSLSKNQVVDDLVVNYGQIIFDECHHLSAVSFESVALACRAKYVLGLSATLTRKDGHHPIVFMQCGPIRHEVNAKKQASKRPFDHFVIQRHTDFEMPSPVFSKHSMTHIYQALVNDDLRNQFILNDIKKALFEKRSLLVLTERREHVLLLAEKIQVFVKNIFVMQGGMDATKRELLLSKLRAVSPNEEVVIIATGRYLGEGFDYARLDTLFLVMPISWKGTLAQYVGRLHRLYDKKTDVRIYDYVDSKVPMLERMSEKRRVGYKHLGYSFIEIDQNSLFNVG